MSQRTIYFIAGGFVALVLIGIVMLTAVPGLLAARTSSSSVSTASTSSSRPAAVTLDKEFREEQMPVTLRYPSSWTATSYSSQRPGNHTEKVTIQNSEKNLQVVVSVVKREEIAGTGDHHEGSTDPMVYLNSNGFDTFTLQSCELYVSTLGGAKFVSRSGGEANPQVNTDNMLISTVPVPQIEYGFFQKYGEKVSNFLSCFQARQTADPDDYMSVTYTFFSPYAPFIWEQDKETVKQIVQSIKLA